jgi:hypothetical protein
LRDVIAPLVHERSVRVLPMQTGRSGLPRLIEICLTTHSDRFHHRPEHSRW